MNGQKQQQAQQQQSKPNTASSSSVVSVAENNKENSTLKSEVSTLKQRIEDMTKNIDQLTTMVQKVSVSVQQPQQPCQQQPVTPPLDSTNKRKKVEPPVYDLPVPDQMLSSAQTTTAMDIEDMVLPPSIPSPMPLEREFSNTSELSDEGFVNHLFTAFKTEDFFDDMEESVDAKKKNRPRPELMERLGEALAMLPRDIQELIVDRLIQAITSPKQIQEHISAVKCLDTANTAPGGKALLPSPVPQSPEHEEEEEEEDEEDHDELAKHQQKVGLPLAAATLAALLSQYSGELDSKQSNQAHKTLPVIPVHA
jgi:ribosomal protein L12E/L44/L45/RPP1/RPP2